MFNEPVLDSEGLPGAVTPESVLFSECAPCCTLPLILTVELQLVQSPLQGRSHSPVSIKTCACIPV